MFCEASTKHVILCAQECHSLKGAPNKTSGTLFVCHGPGSETLVCPLVASTVSGRRGRYQTEPCADADDCSSCCFVAQPVNVILSGYRFFLAFLTLPRSFITPSPAAASCQPSCSKSSRASSGKTIAIRFVDPFLDATDAHWFHCCLTYSYRFINR